MNVTDYIHFGIVSILYLQNIARFVSGQFMSIPVNARVKVCRRTVTFNDVNLVLEYTPRQKFSIFQLHSTFVTNPAE